MDHLSKAAAIAADQLLFADTPPSDFLKRSSYMKPALTATKPYWRSDVFQRDISLEDVHALDNNDIEILLAECRFNLEDPTLKADAYHKWKMAGVTAELCSIIIKGRLA